MRGALLDRLLAERAAKHPVALVTDIPGGAQALVMRAVSKASWPSMTPR